MAELSGARALVTGAAGFLGAHLVRRLVSESCETIGVIRPESNPWRLRGVAENMQLVEADVMQLEAAIGDAGISGVHTVFHLAAAGVDPSRSQPEDVVATNVLGTLQALRTATRLGAERFVYCGSCSEYGSGAGLQESALPQPATEYGASKAAGWLLAHAYGRRCGLPVVTLRLFTIYGPLEASNRLIPHTISACLDDRPLPLTGGRQTRDFVYVADAVDALRMAMTSSAAPGGTFNICTGVETSVREVVSMIAELTGGTARPQFGALPYRPAELWRQCGDPTESERVLGWRASTSLATGVARTLESLRPDNSLSAARAAEHPRATDET